MNVWADIELGCMVLFVCLVLLMALDVYMRRKARHEDSVDGDDTNEDPPPPVC